MTTRKTTTPAARQLKSIDWPEIKRRMESVRTAVEQVAVPASEETRRILQVRAQALARASETAEAGGEYIEVLEFSLAQEGYAVETLHVRDVYPLEQLTPLPCTPAFVLGIVNLRGEILSVIDIKKFFDLPEKGLTNLNKVIVLESATMRFGILADAIAGTRRIPVASIQRSLPTLTGIREQYLKGVTPDRTTILDAEALLTDPTIVIQEQVHE
jgi:purine-binding chemotaxis protein CheW